MAALENYMFFMGKLVTYKSIPNFSDVSVKARENLLHSASDKGNTKIIDLFLNTNSETLEDFVNQKSQ